MPNENCLKGYGCPKCGSEGPFWIWGTTRALMCDDGTMEHEGFDWEGSAWMQCYDCKHEAIARRFRIEKEDESPPPEAVGFG